jgi:serine/threonine protein phosphatase PrpC
MRLTTDSWTITSGVKIGHYHLEREGNCQDAATFGVMNDIVFGVVCDGCGSSEHSEVGSNLTSQFVVHKLAQFIEQYNNQRESEIISNIFESTVTFVQNSCFPFHSSAEFHASFVNNYWLCTIMGFIISQDFISIFYVGDGVYCIDSSVSDGTDNLRVIDQHNAPEYLAYRCINPQFLKGGDVVLPIRFQTVIRNTEKVERLMIATDGFTNHRMDRVYQWGLDHDQELPTSLHGEQWQKKGQFGLKKWMNAMSGRGYFDDDCAIITAERVR